MGCSTPFLSSSVGALPHCYGYWQAVKVFGMQVRIFLVEMRKVFPCTQTLDAFHMLAGQSIHFSYSRCQYFFEVH